MKNVKMNITNWFNRHKEDIAVLGIYALVGCFGAMAVKIGMNVGYDRGYLDATLNFTKE